MELGPIFRALFYNRARFWLITVEVALTLAIVVNCVNILMDLRKKFLSPTGYDESNLVTLTIEPFAPAYQDTAFLHQATARDLERLRSFPGVRDAIAISALPVSGGGSSTGRKAEGSKGDSTSAPYFEVSDHALSTLGVQLVAGRNFQPGEYRDWSDENGEEHDRPAILSQKLADKLFPDGNALGKRITNRTATTSNIVVGIVAVMQNSWPNAEQINGSAMLLPGQPEDKRFSRYMVRTEPGARASVVKGVDEMLLKIDPGRIVTVHTFDDVKRRTYGGELGLIKILGSVVLLLVAVTVFGIVGLTSFSVSQRRRQIGTRRALGATRQDILRYFLLENWLVTGTGLAMGLALAYGLNYALAKLAEGPKLDWGLLAGGMVLLWVSGILAALAPALRATRVPPVVATRTV